MTTTPQPSARPPASGRASLIASPQSPRAAGAPAAGRGWPRAILRSLVAVVLALGLAGTGALGAAAAGASTTTAPAVAGTCTRTVTGTHHGVLMAGHGVLCLDRATQSGPVRVWPGAGLQVTASVISGAVTAARSRAVWVCESTIIGPVRIAGATGPVTAGGTGTSCRGDTIHGQVMIIGSAGPVRVAGLRQQGPVTLSGNAGGVALSGASVGGTVKVRGNRGPVLVSGDVISGSLACGGNRPRPTDAGKPDTVAGTADGQCAGLVPPRPPRHALPPLDQDLSSALPNLNYGQAVGDFTGAGHDQLAYALNGQLMIANPNKFGGQVGKTTATDLQATPNDGFTQCSRNTCSSEPVWQDSWYSANGSTYGMTSVKVAASASNIYMAGATWNGQYGGGYQLHLYKLPHDGSCASASCAQATADLPSQYNWSDFWTSETRTIVATSLTVGVVGGRTLIAVGLSDYGIYVFDDNLNVVAHITDMGVGGTPPTQTPVTALAFGPPTGPGQGGVLAMGDESPGPDNLYGYHLNPDGTEASHWGGGGAGVVLSAAVAQINGQQMAVFGSWDPRGLALVGAFPMSGTGGPGIGWSWPDSQAGAMPSGITPLTPWNADPGNQELVVGSYDGTDDRVLQDQDGTAAYVPFAPPTAVNPDGATTGTANQVYQWWPGYGLGVLQVADGSAGPVDIAMASRPDPGYGCWLDIGLDHPSVPAFPDSDTRVDAGTTSAGYLIAALTGGDCASAQKDSASEHATYVVITPAGDSADEHIVKLVSAADGTLSIAAQAGGDLTATVQQLPQPGGLWGTWQLTVSGGSTPAASAAPSVVGYRLTAAPDPANYQPPTSPAADDPCRPVYRFDVTGAQWTHVASAGQQTAQIPAMTAQGSSDGGKTWADLGQLMPATHPAVAADGTVTLGPASFFFQNTPGTATPPGVWTSPEASQCPAAGTAPVTEVRVVSGGLASSPVMLADPKAPPLNGGPGATPVDGLQAVPDGDGGAAAMPLADGVDQAGLTLQLIPSGGGSIDSSDPRYSLVYYRDDATKALVTGLYQPGAYADYVSVGHYAADGEAGEPNRNWLVTTSTAPGNLDAVMNDSGTTTPSSGSASQPFKVAAYSNPLTPVGTATGGIGITGCTASPTGTCTLAVPAATAPALYQAGDPADGPVTGLQFSVTAITGRVSLPLQVGTANAHNLGTAPLDVTASQAKLTDTSQFWPTDTIDTALVTAGQLVPAVSIHVGS
jgi:hypothetical protein